MTRPLKTIEALLEDISLEPMLDESDDGTPVPRLAVTGSVTMSMQQVGAAILALAALVELATPDAGTWRVKVEHEWGNEGSVYLELRDDDRLQAGLAMAVLEQVVQQVG